MAILPSLSGMRRAPDSVDATLSIVEDAMPTPSVVLKRACVCVGGRSLWSNLDLTINQGDFVAVLGPNGAGKSTLLKALLGTLPLCSGTARVLGHPPGQANRLIGYLPQRRSFDSSLRVRGIDLVRLGLDGTRLGLPLPFGQRRREEDRRIHEAIEAVGATHYANRPIGQVSGGEQQRLLIAQALVRKPRMLLLDEPLDGLDLPNQHAVAALIRTLSCEEHITVVMVAHDVNPIVAELDQVIYVARGRAMAGRPQDVVTSETLSALYDTPIDVLRTADGRLVVVGAPDGHTHHAHC